MYCFEVFNVLMHKVLARHSHDGVNIQLMCTKYHCQHVVLVAIP
jgi:hypothetical protein